MSYYKINGVALPTPSKAEYIESMIQSDAYRDLNGRLHKQTIGMKRKVVLTWEYLTSTDLKAIKSLTRNVKPEFFNFEYYNETTQHSGSFEAYCGADINYNLYSLRDPATGEWTGLSLSFIER